MPAAQRERLGDPPQVDVERLVGPLLHPLHVLEVDDGFAVDPDELLLREPVLPGLEAARYPPAGAIGGHQLARVAGREDAHDPADPEEPGAPIHRQENEVGHREPAGRFVKYTLPIPVRRTREHLGRIRHDSHHYRGYVHAFRPNRF